MLSRIVGMLLGLGLGGLGYVILLPGGLGGRLPALDLGPFQSLSTFVAAAAAGLGLVVFIAALMPKGPGGPSGGGGRRRKGEAPILVDFTSGPASPAHASPPQAGHGPHAGPAPKTTTSARPAPPGSPQGPPRTPESFADVRRTLRNASRDERWSEAAALLRRLSSLAGDDRERMLAAQDAGDFARGQGQFDTASEAYDEALSWARRTGDSAALADALTNTGDVAYETHRLDVAVDAYEECLALRRELALSAPRDIEAQRRLSLALERLADVREDRGHRMRARDLYLESAGIAARLAAADPARFNRDLEVTRRRLAELEARIAL